MAADIPRPTLSFGIEFEFCVASLHCGEDSHGDNRVRDLTTFAGFPIPDPGNAVRPQSHRPEQVVRSNIVYALRRAGLVAGTRWGMGSSWDPINGKAMPTGGISSDHITTPQRWDVNSDSSVSVPTGAATRGYRWFNVEISSPALWFTPEGLRQVSVFCETMRTDFLTEVNPTCGLHVHVGNGNHGLPVDVVKRLVGLLWCFDAQISSIHPTHRRQGPDSFYCKALRTHSILARYGCIPCPSSSSSSSPALSTSLSTASSPTTLPRPSFPLWVPPNPPRKSVKPVSDTAAIVQVQAAPDLETIVSLCSHDFIYGDAMAYKLNNLLEVPVLAPAPGVIIKRTIEFRQHAATLDGAHSIAWIQTVVGLVLTARDALPAALWELLLGEAARADDAVRANVPEKRPSRDVVAFLRMWGLEAPAKFYETFLPRYRESDEWNARAPNWDRDINSDIDSDSESESENENGSGGR